MTWFSDNQIGDDCFDLFVVGDGLERDGKNVCFDLLEVGDAKKRDDTEEPHGQMDQEETVRPRKNGKCNLRKSLAWDSAFFTNEGMVPFTYCEIYVSLGRTIEIISPPNSFIYLLTWSFADFSIKIYVGQFS